MGEFDKCHICIGILNDLDSILGLICITLQFMHMFLLLHSVLVFSSFDCRLVYVEPNISIKA